MSSKIDMVAGDYPVFVLGSNGFSGSSFVKSLIEQGINVRGYSRSPQPDHRFLPYSWITNKGNFEFVQLDLNRQLDYLLRDIVKFRPRVIANFAAQSMVGESWNTPEDWMQTNVVATASMVKAFASFDFLEKYIHFTTPEVYGSTNDWIPESFDFYPSTPYALSRATGDWLVRLWVENFDLPAVFTRAANIYGEGQQLYRIIPKTILFGMTNRKIPLHGGGRSIRSFVHMDDVSSALIKIIEKGEIGATYHISPNDSISIFDLVSKIGHLIDIDPKNLYTIADDRIGKDQAYLLDSKFIQNTLEWAPKISLETGLKRCIGWVKGNLDYLSTLDTIYSHKL
jgi:dTDP-glucose 4,6-dehydratase